MKKTNQPIELIIQKNPASSLAKALPIDYVKLLKAAGIDAMPVTNSVPLSTSFSKSVVAAAPTNNLVLKTQAKDIEINPWDLAHLSADALGANFHYIEPNFQWENIVENKVDAPLLELNAKAFVQKKSDDDYDEDWDPQSNVVWHLDDKYSQLKSARDAVKDISYDICIGHLDTGYSQTHFAVPDSIRNNPLQHNFVRNENPDDAHDPGSAGFLKMPYHGTGTVCLLAGTFINIPTSNGNFNDFLGGAHFAEVICCRIAESVVLLKTNSFAEALEYLTKLTKNGKRIHVVSMSMGGAPSKIWADAVNAAYEAGIIIVTATGNNYNGFPTRHIIYPARFGRVIGAAGATYNMRPYQSNKFGEMDGNFGPTKDMSKVLSAFTPNTPWASGKTGTISFSGAGTSSATPQIAAAAAIYYKKNHQALDALEPWQRVEAVRKALYDSAITSVGDIDIDNDFQFYFGNGILQANAALSQSVATDIPKTPEDRTPRFPILNTIFKAVPDVQMQNKLEMYNTELAQLVYSYPELAIYLDPEKEFNMIDPIKWDEFKKAVIAHPETSVTLKKYLQQPFVN